MIKPRDYQERAVDNVFSDWRHAFSTMLVAATGSGKTETMLLTMTRILADEPDARILYLVHREELASQPLERIDRHWPSLQGRAGIVMADRDSADSQIVVASVQTLNAGGRLDRILQNGPIDYVFTDECHHAVANTYQNVYDRLAQAQPFKHLGVTATPIRSDENGLSQIYQRVADRITIDKLIKRGYLAQLRTLAISTGISLKGAKKSGKGEDRDYTPSTLRDNFESPELWRLVVESHKKYAAGRKAIAFTATVDGAVDLAEAFNAAGIPAAFVCGDKSRMAAHGLTRQGVLDDYRSGAIQVIANVAVLTEGFDAPETSCVHMCRPTQSDGYYLQAMGRGLRIFPGKTDCLVLDYAPKEYRNIKMVGDVLGVPLPDKDVYVDDEVEDGEVQAGFTFDGEEFAWMDDSPMEIISRQLDYLKMTPWVWQQTKQNDWMVLGLGKGSDEIERTLVLSPPAPIMRLYGVWRNPGEYNPQAQEISVGTFEELFERGEELADKHGQPVLMQKANAWRNDPPSDGQAKFARKLGIKCDSMSKGEVANAITRKLALDAIKRTGIEVTA